MQDADLVSAYKIGLQWNVPIDAETTGGSEITGFNLRFAALTSCVSCSDIADDCINQRNGIVWQTTGIMYDTGILGPVSSFIFTAKKGVTYVFSIAARTVIGRVCYTCSWMFFKYGT
jgi:hypothetical protein